jgi:GNAT superfamily N-acetyltransferase
VPEVRQLSAAETRSHLDALAGVLLDCVAGGASVSFMAPFSREDAEAFFEKTADELEAGKRILLAAFIDSELVGTVQILTAMPPNQPHRGEVAKLLVHRSARSKGVGRRLMECAEEAAARAGKTLLVLDTASGSAERIYLRLGWTRLGVIPNYALLPDGEFCDTAVFYKQLREGD